MRWSGRRRRPTRLVGGSTVVSDSWLRPPISANAARPNKDSERMTVMLPMLAVGASVRGETGLGRSDFVAGGKDRRCAGAEVNDEDECG